MALSYGTHGSEAHSPRSRPPSHHASSISPLTQPRMPTNWQYFPKSDQAPDLGVKVVAAFEAAENAFVDQFAELDSNRVLAIVRTSLQALGFRVETGKKAAEKVRVPVLFGRNGVIEKSFEADAWHSDARMVLEVEAGRGYANNQFLKDLFQACMMHDVDYCVIAVRNLYITSHDFEYIVSFFETLYASRRLTLPLKGILVIGYGPDGPV